MNPNMLMTVMLGRFVAIGQGARDADATRLALLAAVVSRRPFIGLALVAFLARREASPTPIPASVGMLPTPRLFQLKAVAAGSDRINLFWVPPPAAKTFIVMRAEHTSWLPISRYSTETSYSDGGLDPTTSYTYVVMALDGNGDVFAASTMASATTT